MAKITTETNWLHIDGSLIPKGSRTITRLGNGVRLTWPGGHEDILVDDSTIDGADVTGVDQLFDFFKANGFKYGGGAPGEGVQGGSVTLTGDGTAGQEFTIPTTRTNAFAPVVIPTNQNAIDAGISNIEADGENIKFTIIQAENGQDLTYTWVAI